MFRYAAVFQERSRSSGAHVLLAVYTQALSALDPTPLYGLESLMKKAVASEGMHMFQQLKASADRLVLGVVAHFKVRRPPNKKDLADRT